MPLSKIQSDILLLIAGHLDPESYVAGSTPLNRDAPRYSGDIDAFHDREERVAEAAQTDAALLQEHGYALEWRRREPGIYALLASCSGETTKLCCRAGLKLCRGERRVSSRLSSQVSSNERDNSRQPLATAPVTKDALEYLDEVANESYSDFR